MEGYDAGSSIDLVKLDGTWRLHYTSAPDVLILFESAARLPFFFQVHFKKPNTPLTLPMMILRIRECLLIKVILFVQVGQIYQKFECRDRSDGGIVRNVVRWSIPSVLEV